MGRNNRSVGGALAAVLLVVCAAPLVAQTDTDRQTQTSLKNQIERRFDVLVTQSGLLLRLKVASPNGRAVELANGTVAIDGNPVTGAELRRRLGADADLVLRLSYLSPADQRALFVPSVEAPAPPEPPVVPGQRAPRPPRPPRFNRGESDRVRFGGDVQVNEGESVGDVVAIGGSARVDGQVMGNVVAIGGDVDLGPHADVDDDVTVVGGTLRRDPAARIGGGVNEVAWDRFNRLPGRLRGLTIPGQGLLAMGSRPFAFAGTVTRLAVLCLFASIILVFGREHVETIGRRAAAEPLKAGLVGLVIQLLFFPVLLASVVVMIVTIVGIPLLALVPIALFALAVVFLVGFTAVVIDVGRAAATRFGMVELNPYFVAILGIVVVLSPVVIGRLVGIAGGVLTPIAAIFVALGFFVEYIAWTVGLGAVALSRFARP